MGKKIWLVILLAVVIVAGVFVTRGTWYAKREVKEPEIAVEEDLEMIVRDVAKRAEGNVVTGLQATLVRGQEWDVDEVVSVGQGDIAEFVTDQTSSPWKTWDGVPTSLGILLRLEPSFGAAVFGFHPGVDSFNGSLYRGEISGIGIVDLLIPGVKYYLYTVDDIIFTLSPEVVGYEDFVLERKLEKGLEAIQKELGVNEPGVVELGVDEAVAPDLAKLIKAMSPGGSPVVLSNSQLQQLSEELKFVLGISDDIYEVGDISMAILKTYLDPFPGASRAWRVVVVKGVDVLEEPGRWQDIVDPSVDLATCWEEVESEDASGQKRTTTLLYPEVYEDEESKEMSWNDDCPDPPNSCPTGSECDRFFVFGGKCQDEYDITYNDLGEKFTKRRCWCNTSK
ncbi:MAG TPA: hypothetical protein ENF20_02385 [Candidatus Marinimicrobia bacterium]|nr:hypothetical protein [Candidatus Neomarinimicrobiota bacterium]